MGSYENGRAHHSEDVCCPQSNIDQIDRFGGDDQPSFPERDVDLVALEHQVDEIRKENPRHQTMQVVSGARRVRQIGYQGVFPSVAIPRSSGCAPQIRA